jgi:chemotaxis regulatin CheY-phosphate phosphatase CheZ
MRANRIVRSPGIWITAAALSAMAGGLLTLACERRDETPDVSANNTREEAREAVDVASDTMRKQVADLERSFATAEREAKQEVEQARNKAQDLSADARERLDAAIERTETARDNASDRIDELKEATHESWDNTRQRVADALEELSEARHEVAAALRGETTG